MIHIIFGWSPSLLHLFQAHYSDSQALPKQLFTPKCDNVTEHLSPVSLFFHLLKYPLSYSVVSGVSELSRITLSLCTLYAITLTLVLLLQHPPTPFCVVSRTQQQWLDHYTCITQPLTQLYIISFTWHSPVLYVLWQCDMPSLTLTIALSITNQSKGTCSCKRSQYGNPVLSVRYASLKDQGSC